MTQKTTEEQSKEIASFLSDVLANIHFDTSISEVSRKMFDLADKFIEEHMSMQNKQDKIESTVEVFSDILKTNDLVGMGPHLSNMMLGTHLGAMTLEKSEEEITGFISTLALATATQIAFYVQLTRNEMGSKEEKAK